MHVLGWGSCCINKYTFFCKSVASLANLEIWHKSPFWCLSILKSFYRTMLLELNVSAHIFLKSGASKHNIQTSFYFCRKLEAMLFEWLSEFSIAWDKNSLYELFWLANFLQQQLQCKTSRTSFGLPGRRSWITRGVSHHPPEGFYSHHRRRSVASEELKLRD